MHGDSTVAKSKAKYKIRLAYRPGQANKSVLDEIKQLDAKYFPGCKSEPLKDTYWWLVYDEKDNVVGYAGMRYLDNEQYGYFSRAAIAEKHRGSGLHKRLITSRIKMARRLGGEGVITYTAQYNNASMNALISRGFKMYTPERRWAGPDFMYLKLSFVGE
jgi:N-acetylglutamate synthase-like GNAT family acetyltransferase